MSSRGKKGKSAKKPKPTVKSLTKELEELTRVNDELKLKAETMTTEHGLMKARLDAVGKKIINFVDKEQFNVSESTDVLEISTETFLEMVSKIITRRSLNKSTLESRLEELETRVTHQSMQVAKLTQINLAYENAVIDLGKCRHMQEVNDIVDQIQILQLQTGLYQQNIDPSGPRSSRLPGLPVESRAREVISPAAGEVAPRPGSSITNGLPTAVIAEFEKSALTPPIQKLPGNTHLKNMHKELRLFLMKDLSLERASGADWRMLAVRVGLSTKNIEYWKSLRLECPMGRVFAEWGESESATVRMLHRHLISPQMRCAILAKRVADFYEVS